MTSYCPNNIVMLKIIRVYGWASICLWCNWVNVFRVSKTNNKYESPVSDPKICCVFRTEKSLSCLFLYLCVHHQISATHFCQLYSSSLKGSEACTWTKLPSRGLHCSFGNFGIINTSNFEITFVSVVTCILRLPPLTQSDIIVSLVQMCRPIFHIVNTF